MSEDPDCVPAWISPGSFSVPVYAARFLPKVCLNCGKPFLGDHVNEGAVDGMIRWICPS